MIPLEAYRENLAQLLSPIAGLLQDPGVSEVLINGARTVYAERRGKLERFEGHFDSEEHLMAALRSVAQLAGKPLDWEHPVLEARLPDGSRLEAVIPPASPEGATVCIRRFARSGLSMDDLVRKRSLTPPVAARLAEAVQTRRNLLVSGGTGSGKTSLLNALGGLIETGQRVITIEDARELQLGHSHVVALESRPKDARGRGQVTIADLFRASLRLRPDRIVIGELRGGEALSLVQAMTSGHGGCLSTIHASSAQDALRRLETLALSDALAPPLHALRPQVASAIDVIVQIERMPDGARRVTQVARVAGLDDDGAYRIEREEMEREGGTHAR